jgi:hypothetical protein
VTWVALLVRTELAAAASLADILARSKFRMAMAAMIRIIATTSRSSIRENAFPHQALLFSLRWFRRLTDVPPIGETRNREQTCSFSATTSEASKETPRRLLLELANS